MLTNKELGALKETSNTWRGGIHLNAEEKQEIKETVDLLEQLDETSLTLVRSNIEILHARQQLDEKKTA